jgi:hypothetical protein
VTRQEGHPLAVGDSVEFWITGIVRTYTGTVIELRDDGPRIRVNEPDWPMILKPGDYIIRTPRKADS